MARSKQPREAADKSVELEEEARAATDATPEERGLAEEAAQGEAFKATQRLPDTERRDAPGALEKQAERTTRADEVGDPGQPEDKPTEPGGAAAELPAHVQEDREAEAATFQRALASSGIPRAEGLEAFRGGVTTRGGARAEDRGV